MPDNNQPTPNPGAVLGGAPDTSQLPAASNAAPPALAPSAPPQPQPDKHAVLGRFASHVRNALEGKQTAYVPDRTPDGALTGQVKEVQVPRKPGGIFRDILSGMLTGMAASSTNTAHPSGAAGLGLGFMGAQQAAQVTDSRVKNRAVERATAQKNAQDQENAKKDSDNLAQAAIAQGTMSSLDFGHHIGLHSDKDVDSHNNSVEVVRREALNNGGALAQIDHNGEPGNGPALMEAFNKDPQSVMQAPDGFHRIPMIKYDTSGLQHKDGKWTNADGSPLSDDEWNKRATVSLIDLPTSAWTKRVTLTKQSANDVAGRTIAQGNPTDSVSTDFGSLFGLGLKNLAQMNKDRAESLRPPKTEAEAKGWKSRIEEIRQKMKDDPDSVPEEDKKFLQDKGAMIDKYPFKTQAPTKAQIGLETEELEKKLTAGTITPEERATLAQRQKAEATKGVPADIIAAIGARPIPADYPKGDKDPQFKADSKLWGNASLNKKAALQASQGLARYQMLGRIRAYNVVDTETGQMSEMNANQLADASEKAPGKFVLATQDGTKTMGKQAAIKDIQFNLDNTKDKIDALDNLDAGTRLKLAVALRDTDPHSSISTFLQSQAGQALDEKQQDAVIALNSMAENVMLLRAVQGVGGAGSDMMRQALINLIPSGKTPTKGYAKKQLDTVQRTLDQLKTGVPTVGKQSNQPVGNTPAPSKPPAPASHVFDPKAWQAANPKGDVNAAIAAAKSQGFQIKQ